MKIGIDARLFGPKDTGIGRYTQCLVENILAQDKKNQYVLFVRNKQETKFQISKLKSQNLKIVIADFCHYSLKEQLFFPFLLYKEKLDLVHFPHFNVPILYFGCYVVTIHDLIKHMSKGAETTTRTPYFYWLKYLGYRLVFWLAVKRAKLIFVPSKTVALQLIKVYKIPESKIKVTYEGVGENLKSQISNLKSEEILEKYKIKKNYLLYVGNVYPHKNIPNLIKAVKLLITNYKLLITLVIVCARNVFLERLERRIKEFEAERFIKLLGFVPDQDLKILYQNAEAFVFPSKSEGFGLPGLEAMACGLPVLASDIPVFKEIYNNAALYFDPDNPKDIAQKINEFLINKSLQRRLKIAGLKQAKNYCWKKTALETLNGYQKV